MCLCCQSECVLRQGDVTAMYGYGFDAIKLDGYETHIYPQQPGEHMFTDSLTHVSCGAQTDLQQYYDLMNATGLIGFKFVCFVWFFF